MQLLSPLLCYNTQLQQNPLCLRNPSTSQNTSIKRLSRPFDRHTKASLSLPTNHLPYVQNVIIWKFFHIILAENSFQETVVGLHWQIILHVMARTNHKCDKQIVLQKIPSLLHFLLLFFLAHTHRHTHTFALNTYKHLLSAWLWEPLSLMLPNGTATLWAHLSCHSDVHRHPRLAQLVRLKQAKLYNTLKLYSH